MPTNVRRLFSLPSWPSWAQLLYKAVDAWGNADFLGGKMDMLRSFILSPWAVVLALAWLFIIAFGWHTKLWSLVMRRKSPESGQPRSLKELDAELTSLEKSRIINLEKDKPRWEHVETDLRNLESELRRYKDIVRGEGYRQDGERLVAIERQIESMQTVLQPLNTQTDVKELLENVNRLESNLSGLQTEVRELRNDLGPRSNLDVDAIRRSIRINYVPSDPGFIVAEMGMIQRRLVFRFEITHFSPNVRIEPTRIVKGALIAYDSRQDAMRWSVRCPDPKLLSVGDKLILRVDYPITERFAETLAFKANYDDRMIDLDFSEMEVEFRAHSLDGTPGPVVGFRSLGGTVHIPIDDHVAFKSIRDVYSRLHPQ